MSYVCGIRLDGTLLCEGNHQTWEISPPVGRFHSISAVSIHVCGVRIDETVTCWATHGEAYDEDASQLTPPQGAFRSVSVGGSWSGSSEFSCEIRTDGSLRCWSKSGSQVLKNLLENWTERSAHGRSRATPQDRPVSARKLARLEGLCSAFKTASCIPTPVREAAYRPGVAGRSRTA